MQEDQQVSNSDMFIVVQCLNCNTMASLGCVIPGMAVYSSETRLCSNCMDTDTFKYLTGQ